MTFSLEAMNYLKDMTHSTRAMELMESNSCHRIALLKTNEFIGGMFGRADFKYSP